MSSQNDHWPGPDWRSVRRACYCWRNCNRRIGWIDGVWGCLVTWSLWCCWRMCFASCWMYCCVGLWRCSCRCWTSARLNAAGWKLIGLWCCWTALATLTMLGPGSWLTGCLKCNPWSCFSSILASFTLQMHFFFNRSTLHWHRPRFQPQSRKSAFPHSITLYQTFSW